MIKAKPSVEIYNALTKRGYTILSCNMITQRRVMINYRVGVTHTGGASYAGIEHSWDEDEEFDLREIIEEMDKKIKEFYLADSMDESLD